MLPRRNVSSHSLASLVIAPDDHEYLSKVRNILEEHPRTAPPDDPTELCPYLFMGSLKNANNLPLLKALGITHVLNCAGNGNIHFMRNPYSYDSGIVRYLTITAEDHAEYDIMRHFDETFAFLNECKQSGGKALVHCNLGINRSGAICAAYLMADQQMPLLQVIALLKRKRNLVLCNKGFRRQLIRFARTTGYLECKKTTARKEYHTFGTDRTNTIATPWRRTCSFRDSDHSDSVNDIASVRQIKPYGRSKSATTGNTENFTSEHSSNSLHLPSNSSLTKPSRFSPAYHSLPKSSIKASLKVKETPARKRPLNASHYDKEYFMDTIPEDARFSHNKDKSEKLPKKEASPNLSSFGNRSLMHFRKSKSKSTDCLNGSPVIKPAQDSVLSSTRPLRVYKRSVTDTELYEKPTVTHQYKRADTVATTDITAGMQRMNIDEASADTNLTRQQRSLSKLSLSTNFFSRLKPESWKRSSRNSLNISA